MFGLSLKRIWIILFIAALVVLIVYYLIYTIKINQHIRSGNKKEIRMIDFPKIIMIVTIVLLFSICVVNTVSPAASVVISRNNYAVIDTSDYEYISYFSDADLDDASYAKAFSENGNSGYAREEFTDGDFDFIVFTSTTPPDSFHPDFFCYVTYTGSGAAAMSLGGQFQNIGTDEKVGSSFMGETINKMLVIGNYEDDYQFVLTASVYDEIDKESYDDASEGKMESLALSTGKVLIK